MSQAYKQFQALGKAFRFLGASGDTAYSLINNAGSILLGISLDNDVPMTAEQEAAGQLLNDVARASFYDEPAPEAAVELPTFSNDAVVDALTFDIGRQGFDSPSAALVTALAVPFLLGLDPNGRAVDGPEKDEIRRLVHVGVEGYKRGVAAYLGVQSVQQLSAGGSA